MPPFRIHPIPGSVLPLPGVHLHRSAHGGSFPVAVRMAMFAALALLLLAGCATPGFENGFENGLEGARRPRGTKPFRLPGRPDLTIFLPPGFKVESERGDGLAIHHVWRSRSLPLEKEAGLGISVGVIRLPYCSRGATPLPSVHPSWKGLWRGCDSLEAGVRVREAFLSRQHSSSVHLFIVGAGEAEMDVLQRIAETLQVR